MGATESTSLLALRPACLSSRALSGVAAKLGNELEADVII